MDAPATSNAIRAAPHRRLLIGLAAFASLSALSGGVELIARPRGNGWVPIDLLRHTPFGTLLVPGLLLTGVVGAASLVCTICAWRRSRATIDATLVAGGALSLWILAEVALLRAFHWLHAVYGGVGLAITALGVLAAWRSERQRHRWMVRVTLFEAAGFMAPMAVALAGYRAGLGDRALSALVVAAGLLEGLALGSGQALAFPLPLRRARYALLSALGAGAVWALALSMQSLMDSAAGVSPAVLAVVLPSAVVVGLGAIGTAQWLELRHHSTRAHLFIAWTALAWAVALPLSFLPGVLVDESTPLAAQLALFFCGGVLMAFTMALVTWPGARGVIASRRNSPLTTPRRPSCAYS